MKFCFISFRLVLFVLAASYHGTASGTQDDVVAADDASVQTSDDAVISALDFLATAEPEQVPGAAKEVTSTLASSVDGAAAADDVNDTVAVPSSATSDADSLAKVGDSVDSDNISDIPAKATANSDPPGVLVNEVHTEKPGDALPDLSAEDESKDIVKEATSAHLIVDDKEDGVVTDTSVKSETEDVADVKPGPLVVSDKEVLVVEVRGGKSYDGKVCSPPLNDTEDGLITMPPPPLDPLCKAYFWTASVEKDFVVDITLEALKVDHKVGEFMLIGPGSDKDALWVDETNPMITASVTTPKLFRVLTSHVFSVFLVTNTPTGFTGNFTLRYQPEGLIETTPEQTTPGPTLPTPGPNTTAEIVIYLGGKSADIYNEIDQNNATLKDKLRAAIAVMAHSYSSDSANGISLAEPITADNVVFSMLRGCSASWRDSATCVQVNMSVAAIVSTAHYEMSAGHLNDMWNRIDKNDPGLKDLGLHKYDEPNAVTSMYVWLGLSLIVLIAFIFILIVVWRVEIWDYHRMRSKDELSYSQRGSTASNDSAWFPASEHQLVPPYMEAFSDTGYVEYEPEFDGPAPALKYQTLPSAASAPATGYNLPPRYGAPNAFGGAIHFYGNNARKHFDNAAFVEEEEDETNIEVNTSGRLTLSPRSHNDNSMC